MSSLGTQAVALLRLLALDHALYRHATWPKKDHDPDLPRRAGAEMLKQFAEKGYDPILIVFAGNEPSKGLAITGPLYLRHLLQAVPEGVDVLTKTVRDYLTKPAADTPMDDWPGTLTSLKDILKPKEPS